MADDMKTNGAVSLPVVNFPAQQNDAAANILTDDPNDPFNDVKKELRTRFLLLPEEIQRVVIDEAYQVKLFDIAKAQKLTFEELGILEVETTMVLLGMTKPENYRDILQEQLKKNDPEIDTVVKEVNEKVFAPVRTTLEKIYSAVKEPVDFLKDPTEEQETPATTAPTTSPTPVPPVQPVASAAITPAPSSVLSATEKTVLEKTGVVITETAPIAKSAPITMPSRADVLKGIENPTRLGAMAAPMSATKTTDYTVPKPPAQPAMTTPATPAPRTGPDPYREQIN